MQQFEQHGKTVSEPLRLMGILAHPDDESLGLGGTLARYARDGVETYVVCATRGERGRFGDAKERPAPEVVGTTREAELRAAAKVLGVREVSFLDYMDGDLDKANAAEAIGRIVTHIRHVRPQVVVTFGPEGAYGHPDHIAISQFAAAAVAAAADPDHASGNGAQPHGVSKLYYMIWPPDKLQAYQAAFKELKSVVDGVERPATAWPDWVVTTVVDTDAHWKVAWEAINCHHTQLTIYDKLRNLSEEQHRVLWGCQEFYRVFSRVNGGRVRETDLFAGLR